MYGKFITFEGGEGSGKSTQSRLLQEALQKQGIPCLLTREPGGTEGAEAIRELLVKGAANRWEPMTEMLLHMAARHDHVEKCIRPALAERKWVLCDRFMDSTLAYQGYGHQLGSAFISSLHRLTQDNLLPDITVLLDIPVTQGLQRAADRRGTETRYEQMDTAFHERLREGFLLTAKQYPERYLVLDALQPVATLHQQVQVALEGRLGIKFR